MAIPPKKIRLVCLQLQLQRHDAILSVALIRALRQRQRQNARMHRRWWEKPWIQRRNLLGQFDTLMVELAQECNGDYVNFLRMEPQMFQELLERVTPHIQKDQRSVWMFCKSAGIPIVEKFVDLRTGEHKKPWFLQLSQMGQLPTIKDDTFVLSESVAIIKYLVGKYEVTDHWYPEDLQKRAKIDEFLAWQHVNLRQKIIDVFREEVAGPAIFGKKVDEAKLEEYLKVMNKALTFVEKHILGTKAYLFGDDITVADLFAVTEIIQTNMSGRDVLKDFPKLRQWFDLVRVTMSPVFEDVHSELFKFRDEIIAKNKEQKREEKMKEMREVRRRESTEPEGEVITLDLDDNLNIKPEQNGDRIGEENGTEATVQVQDN